MISRLKGIVLESTPLLLVLDVGGVGYEVNIPVTTAEKVPSIGRNLRSSLTQSIAKTVPRFMVSQLAKTGSFSAYSWRRSLESGPGLRSVC